MRQSLIAAGMFLLTGGMVGCGTSSTQEKEDLIVVDVSKDYPKKELILQDLFDVEYIPLETTDEFVTLGWLQAIGKDVMIIRNMFAADGDIFIYDRKGKAIRHINRKGQGNEEYAATNGIYLDDEKGELFVGNLRQRKIMTYDLFGNFKRSFTFKEGEDEDTKSWVYYKAIFNFDRDHFICQDASSGRNFNGAYQDLEPRNIFLIVSKQDGSVVEEIKVPFEKKVSHSYECDTFLVGMRHFFRGMRHPFSVKNTNFVARKKYLNLIPSIKIWLSESSFRKASYIF